MNRSKYIGDCAAVVARSSWEMKAFRHLDLSPDIARWSSEEISLPYLDQSTGRRRTYWPDLYFETVDGRRCLVEIKPARFAQLPKIRKGQRRRSVIAEHKLYARNASKWSAAQKFAERNGIEFMVWDEHALAGLGVGSG